MHITTQDFDVFSIPDFEGRMNALKTTIRPKLEQMGQHFAHLLTVETGSEYYPHVAKHARRKVNPPKDTWVAFCENKRGYKMAPHFQIGLWGTHLFVAYGVIYEANDKIAIGHRLIHESSKLYAQTPPSFSWSINHMQPNSVLHSTQSEADLQAMFQRLIDVKSGELLCMRVFDRSEVESWDEPTFIHEIETALLQLVSIRPLWLP